MTATDSFTRMGFGSEFIDDPYTLFAQLRSETPVRKGDVMHEFGAPSYTAPSDPRPKFSLLRYDDISSVLRDRATFSSAFWEETSKARDTLLTMDGEAHRAWRQMLLPVFGRKPLEAWKREVIVPTAERCAAALAASGHGADLVGYAYEFPMHMTYEVLGMASEDPAALARFQTLALESLLGVIAALDAEQMRQNLAVSIAAGKELYAWALATVERTRAAGATGNDLVSHLIRARLEDGELDDDDIAMFVRTIVGAATENTSRQFLNTMVCLLERPALLQAVRDDRALLPQAVVEAERYEPPALTVPRLTTRDVELRGVHIPAGAFVLAVTAAGNRDPEAYPDPDAFDIDRPGPQPLTFGLGPHVCPGMNLARDEIATAIGALLDRLPTLRLDPSHEPPRITGAPLRRTGALHVVWD
jgi:cytochrome P450